MKTNAGRKLVRGDEGHEDAVAAGDACCDAWFLDERRLIHRKEIAATLSEFSVGPEPGPRMLRYRETKLRHG